MLNDITGAGISALIEKENTIIELPDLLTMLPDVVQFDWGDFFLFKDYPHNFKGHEKILDYPPSIVKTDSTIRAIDDTYIYTYTPYHEVVNKLKQNYEIDFIKEDSLENLDFPY